MYPQNDPLLQPFQLKNLRLKTRMMITSHEPAYPEDGMPKAKYRSYHVERARAGIAPTMTAGSATVSRDSPPVVSPSNQQHSACRPPSGLA
jgi:2,4-dienoyl-CoA reductase-like NADH-dependent reductase (Old Yellow Enzyme family)